MSLSLLVTGHDGYIGSVLVPLLLSAGHRVTGCDIGLYRKCSFLGELSEVENLATDVRCLQAKDLANIDAIIHLAGLSNDPLGSFRPQLTEEVNYKASLHLANLAIDSGVERFLFASSCSVYGNGSDDLLDEQSRTNPITPYARSKYQAEVDIALLANERFHPTFLRAGTVYGVSPRIRFDLVLNNLTAWAHASGKVHLKSDGNAWRPMLHVKDLAQAYLSILEAPSKMVAGQAFNIGSTEQNFQIHELASTVNLVLPQSKLEFATNAGADFRNYRVNCDKFAELITARPMTWTIEDGVRELAEALDLRPTTTGDIEGETFNRLTHIQALIRNGELTADLYWKTRSHE
ncbi:MAG: nucleoside-diphosphate-sugar epimerase [Parasphingorhabdus sp.]|jgi:nucleoside-diphosphate-sugar epimerase